MMVVGAWQCSYIFRLQFVIEQLIRVCECFPYYALNIPALGEAQHL